MKSFSKGSLLALEAMGFLILACLPLADETLDLPHMLLGIASTEASWGDIVIDSGAILIVGVIVMALTWKMGPASEKTQIASIPVCAVCKKVCSNGKWITLDSFIESGTSCSFVHGICPDCMDTYYKGVTDTTALNFKHLLKGRKHG